MCWDHSAHGERGISLADAIENERDKTIAELQDTERQIRITVQAGDRPLTNEVSDRIHKMFALQREVFDLTRKLEEVKREGAEDKARLDWLTSLDCDSPQWTVLADSVNLREAIDAARREE